MFENSIKYVVAYKSLINFIYQALLTIVLDIQLMNFDLNTALPAIM